MAGQDLLPPSSADNPVPPHNLPGQATSFVGRSGELNEIETLLAQARLVTLTGAGGVGKTRLAIQVASGLLEESGDGVWLAELAAITDPELVAPAVAAAVGVEEAPDRA